MAAVPYAQSAAGKAASYGWSIAVINSNPELKTLFAQATSQNWTPDEFVARVRDTKWFKANADTARQLIILQKADPATYNARIASATGSASAMAASMGATISAATASVIGRDTLLYGWNSDQIKQHLAAYVKVGNNGQYAGQAGTEQLQYNQLAEEYGVALSPSQLASFIQGSTMGTVNQQTVQNWMIAQAKSRYPSLSERLQSGETLKQIADPYIQSQAKILELNPSMIKLSDPLVQQALSTKDAKGNPTTMSVWEYEQKLRQDPRYMQTQQAQDQGMQMAHGVLQDMGLMS